MPKPEANDVLAAARESLASPINFEDFLSKLAPKDRVNAEKRVGVLDAEPDSSRAPLWRRLACKLMTLAPGAKFVGKQTVQFYIPDGKYRMQVFAMEDLQDGNFTVYCPDIVEEALRAGVIAPPAPSSGDHVYLIPATQETLRIEALDKRSLNPGAHFKDLTGWNRKALRITLPPNPSPAQVDATEMICAMAAQRFVRAPAPPPGTAVPSPFRY